MTGAASPCTGLPTATWISGRTKRPVGRGTGSRSTQVMTFSPSGLRDGTRMVYGALRKTNIVDLYRNLVNGPPGSEELLLSTSQEKFPIDWSADGALSVV